MGLAIILLNSLKMLLTLIKILNNKLNDFGKIFNQKLLLA